MTAAITPAAEPLLEKLDGIHQLLFRTAHMCARAGLGNLRRQLVKGLEDIRSVQDGLGHAPVQRELLRLQAVVSDLKAQAAAAKAKVVASDGS